MKKKAIALLTAAAMTISVLAGCGSSSGTTRARERQREKRHRALRRVLYQRQQTVILTRQVIPL